MYSGNDGNGQFANWQIAAQSQISNLSGNNIDWATLAAQWINMREIQNEIERPTNSFDQSSEILDAPPPPQISAKSSRAFKQNLEEEKGEAEMDLEDDEPNTSQFETIPLQIPSPVPRIQPILNYHLTQYQSQQDWQWPPRVQLPPPVLHIPQVTAPGTTSAQEKLVETLDETKRKSLPAWIR